MPIKYTVVRNSLQPGQFYPRPLPDQTRGLDKILRAVQEKTTVSDADIAAVITSFIREIINGLVDGARVSIDGLADFGVRLSQSMTSATEDFDFDQGGELRIAATIKPAVTEDVRSDATFAKVATAQKVPVLTAFTDSASGQDNAYSPGFIAEVTGDNLKIGDLNDITQGVFFISEADGTPSRASVFQNNGDRKLVFNIPGGLSGNQNFEVRTRYTPGGSLRSGRLVDPLTPA